MEPETGKKVQPRSPYLDPVDRLSEITFGLLMALTFTGTMSVSLGAGGTVQEILYAALGCNIAWGIVDGNMYLLTTATARGRAIGLLTAMRSARPTEVPALVRELIEEDTDTTLNDAEAHIIAGWLQRKYGETPQKPLRRSDLMGALAVVLVVIISTFPPIIPFIVLDDVFTAMRWSNGIAVAMLFGIGWQLDRYIKNGSRIMRFVVPMVGVVLVAATIALGG